MFVLKCLSLFKLCIICIPKNVNKMSKNFNKNMTNDTLQTTVIIIEAVLLVFIIGVMSCLLYTGLMSCSYPATFKIKCHQKVFWEWSHFICNGMLWVHICFYWWLRCCCKREVSLQWVCQCVAFNSTSSWLFPHLQCNTLPTSLYTHTHTYTLS